MTSMMEDGYNRLRRACGAVSVSEGTSSSIRVLRYLSGFLLWQSSAIPLVRVFKSLARNVKRLWGFASAEVTTKESPGAVTIYQIAIE
ncbi:unnamed protein product [Calypogeia fissa]